MRATNLHLNLLRPEEKTSSSPVRLRVMLPILSLLLCAACAIWWGVLFMQGLLLNGKVTSVRADLEGKKTAHAAILAKMADMRERQAQLDQLYAYKKGCHKYGGLLAKLAEVVPEEVQLTALTIPEPEAAAPSGADQHDRVRPVPDFRPNCRHGFRDGVHGGGRERHVLGMDRRRQGQEECRRAQEEADSHPPGGARGRGWRADACL